VDTQDAQEYMGARNEALGAALAEVLEVEVPDTLVTNQAREKYARMMTEMRNNGMGDDEIQKLISPENFIKYKDLYAEVRYLIFIYFLSALMRRSVRLSPSPFVSLSEHCERLQDLHGIG